MGVKVEHERVHDYTYILNRLNKLEYVLALDEAQINAWNAIVTQGVVTTENALAPCKNIRIMCTPLSYASLIASIVLVIKDNYPIYLQLS